MKSAANIKGHPVHPMLVVFPIAFFVGALIFDLLALFNPGKFADTATYMVAAGLIGGLVAAIPGIIDFRKTVPPRSTAKKRAAKHGLLNATVILLFGISLFYRLRSEAPLAWVVVTVESIAIVLLFISGWLGATLVHRNQIGVDIRYAGAGKWKEEFLAEKNGCIVVQSVDTLRKDQMRLIHVGDKRIVVANTGEKYVAFDDRCTHRGASLAAGSMICNTVQCPWHGSQFDVTDGNVKAGPAKETIRVFKVQMHGTNLIIDTTKSGV